MPTFGPLYVVVSESQSRLRWKLRCFHLSRSGSSRREIAGGVFYPQPFRCPEKPHFPWLFALRRGLFNRCQWKYLGRAHVRPKRRPNVTVYYPSFAGHELQAASRFGVEAPLDARSAPADASSESKADPIAFVRAAFQPAGCVPPVFRSSSQHSGPVGPDGIGVESSPRPLVVRSRTDLSTAS